MLDYPVFFDGDLVKVDNNFKRIHPGFGIGGMWEIFKKTD